MKLSTYLVGLSAVALVASCQSAEKAAPIVDLEAQRVTAIKTATPFQNNNGEVPPEGYGSFVLSHDWPTTAPPPLADAPWRDAIGGGLITVDNASAYAEALKAAVAAPGTALFTQGNGFDAPGAGWYNEPWTGSLREPIQGTYPAGEFGPAVFPGTGLKTDFQTHVLTYYDQRAAYTLYNVWNTDAMNPKVETARTQFAEGSIIVKAAVFTSTDPTMPTDWWDAISGAQAWNLFIPVKDGGPSQVWPGYVVQFDIIVKDSKSAPDTGWVFTTLVYDSSIQSTNIWDKMVVLGAQWGNDPQASKPGDVLTQNWINPDAPAYAKMTLGPNDRLSGPNDGARNNIAFCTDADNCGEPQDNVPDSSCMSCHSTAQWNPKLNRMPSFLLPSFPTDSAPYFKLCGPNGDYICSPIAGSAGWMKWFQNRLGTVPMDEGSVAGDFDEVLTFKSLPLWYAATNPASDVPLLTRQMFAARQYNQYTGAPLKNEK